MKNVVFQVNLKPTCFIFIFVCSCSVDTATLGVHSIEDEENEDKFRQVRNVIGHFSHPYYNRRTKENDLMLLQVR